MTDEMEIKNAVIEGADIVGEGALDVRLTLNYGGLHQALAGYALYLPADCKHHKKVSVAGHHIWRCMEIAGVSSWKNMVGRTIRAKSTFGKIHAIGHIINDDWYCPEDDFKEARKEITHNA